MDPVTVAAAAAVLLASQAGEGASRRGRTGKAAWAGLGRLWALVRAKFAGDPPAKQALAAVEEQPADAGRVQQLAEHLAAHARADPQFQAGLQQPVTEARQDPAVGPTVLQVHDYAAIDKVVSFGTATDGALRLYRLPGYSPQLNPDEWVWKNVKADGVAPAAPKGPEQLKAVVTGRLRRLQRLPHIVRGFFGDPELAYIAAAA